VVKGVGNPEISGGRLKERRMPHKKAEKREKSREEGKNKGEVVLNFICVVALWLNVL